MPDFDSLFSGIKERQPVTQQEFHNERERNRKLLRMLLHLLGDIPGANWTEKQKKMWQRLQEELKRDG